MAREAGLGVVEAQIYRRCPSRVARIDALFDGRRRTRSPGMVDESLAMPQSVGRAAPRHVRDAATAGRCDKALARRDALPQAARTRPTTCSVPRIKAALEDLVRRARDEGDLRERP